jgi:hypothetical protein
MPSGTIKGNGIDTQYTFTQEGNENTLSLRNIIYVDKTVIKGEEVE